MPRFEYNCSDAQLRSMMTELKITDRIDLTGLKTAFRMEIRQHHTDKGGTKEKSQSITQAYRVLRAYLEAGLHLPISGSGIFNSRANFATNRTSYSNAAASSCRPSYQRQQASSTGFGGTGFFDQEEEFTQYFSRRKNRGAPAGCGAGGTNKTTVGGAFSGTSGTGTDIPKGPASKPTKSQNSFTTTNSRSSTTAGNNESNTKPTGPFSSSSSFPSSQQQQQKPNQQNPQFSAFSSNSSTSYSFCWDKPNPNADKSSFGGIPTSGASMHSNKKGRGQFTKFSAADFGDAFFAPHDEDTTSNLFKDKSSAPSPPKFVNNYIYDPDDYSKYSDPMERADRPRDGIRKLRGGLHLYKDFHRSDNQQVPQEFEDLRSYADTEGDEIETDPKFKHIIEAMSKSDETIHSFAERLKTFVMVDWILSGDLDANITMNKIRLHRVISQNENAFTDVDDCMYTAVLPAKQFEADILSAGLHLDVRPAAPISASVNGTLHYQRHQQLSATAIVDRVDPDTTTIQLFFVDHFRLRTLLAATGPSNLVNIGVNSSSFVYRSELRSIELVKKWKYMENLVLPKPKYSEGVDDFMAKRADDILRMGFRDADKYNFEQKNAVYSIVSKAHHPWPFVLFGPPGTGKTLTVVEAIRHLVDQSTQNRILVCTPSKMAADNFAEALVDRSGINPKYLFRMHSLSTPTFGRNKKLDPIVYIAKDSRNRFYGIPDRGNLKMFRVIICTLSTSSYLVSAGGLRGYFSHIFIDEAGQATEPSAWVPIGGLAGPQTSVILAGDPQQLGPVINAHLLKRFGYNVSMIERLMFNNDSYRHGADDRHYVVLRESYRFHYAILRPCSYLFYDNILRPSPDEDPLLNKMINWSGLPTKGFPIIFHSSLGSRDTTSPTGSSLNRFEANTVVFYVRKILSETDVKEEAIGVISPYKNQVTLLKKQLAEFPRLTIDSVEAFQGSEREVIIISTVRTGSLGFLKCDQRLNTSISRSRNLLVVIGHDDALSVHTNWKRFIFYCKYHGGYVRFDGQPLAQLDTGNNEESTTDAINGNTTTTTNNNNNNSNKRICNDGKNTGAAGHQRCSSSSTNHPSNSQNASNNGNNNKNSAGTSSCYHHQQQHNQYQNGNNTGGAPSDSWGDNYRNNTWDNGSNSFFIHENTSREGDGTAEA